MYQFTSNQIKPFFYSLYAKPPISASLRLGNIARFEEMSQRWRAVGNTVFDLTGPRYEPQTSRSRDERVTARPMGVEQVTSTFKLEPILVRNGRANLIKSLSNNMLWKSTASDK